MNGITVGRGKNDSSTNANTAVGENALVSISTGEHNTALGLGALQSITSSNFNTGVGSSVLPSLSTGGGYNTAIGYNAGSVANGSYSTYIGSQASASSSSGVLFETVITGGVGSVGGAIGRGTNTILISGETAYLPATIVQNTGTTLTLGDGTTTGGIIAGAISGTTITGTSFTSPANTKLIINSAELANGIIEYQNAGNKRAVIQYNSAMYPLQIISEAGISLETKVGGPLNLATTGGAGNINLITNSVTRGYVGDTGLNFANIQSSTSSMSINTDATTGDTIIGNVSNQSVSFPNTTGNIITFRTSGYPTLQVASSTCNVSHIIGTGGDFLTFYYNGSAIGAIIQTAPLQSSIFIAYTSDYRLKENIKPIDDCLIILDKLKPCHFEWKADGTKTKQIGFIAHEFAEVFPNYVSGEKDAVDSDGKIIGQKMGDSVCIPLLVSCVQKQQDEITNLKAELASLKAVVDALVARS